MAFLRPVSRWSRDGLAIAVICSLNQIAPPDRISSHIQDFLPPPEELAFKEEGVKVTIALSKKSVEFFKSEALKHHTQYQRMIRRLIDTYVDAYDRPLTSRSTRSARKRAAN
jgi:hypothetical protein